MGIYTAALFYAFALEFRAWSWKWEWLNHVEVFFVVDLFVVWSSVFSLRLREMGVRMNGGGFVEVQLRAALRVRSFVQSSKRKIVHLLLDGHQLCSLLVLWPT